LLVLAGLDLFLTILYDQIRGHLKVSMDINR
jgi:hypothetical protein